ncbi:MAG TPA: helix-turn-helix transcriptional regulator [Gammaproteobacteria bacterium]|nr:helix-turn-helix transcriptional regulator [Gammaproteobacteria bacterium]
MTKSFSALHKKMSPASRARVDAMAQAMLREMPLHELRQALNLTQEELASTLHVKQATISKLERRTDMYISTLARFVEAMGGELEVRACFPDGDVKIKSLEGLSESSDKSFAKAS